METITCFQVQELLNQLPAKRLPLAYNLLYELGNKKEDAQLDFIYLPLSERRQIMEQQAKQMVTHYKQTAVERQEWQSGDFIDEY